MHYTRVRSLGVTLVIVTIIVILVAVVIFFFVLFVFLVWLLSKEDIGSTRPIRGVWFQTCRMYSSHAQWYASPRLHTWVLRIDGKE